MTMEQNIEEAATKWVFETNGDRWSNNDDTAPDNYGSFIAGAKWASLQAEPLRKELEATKQLLTDTIKKSEQENKTLKEQQKTLHVEVNFDSLAVAHYENEIEQLRQENKVLNGIIYTLRQENKRLKEELRLGSDWAGLDPFVYSEKKGTGEDIGDAPF